MTGWLRGLRARYLAWEQTRPRHMRRGDPGTFDTMGGPDKDGWT